MWEKYNPNPCGKQVGDCTVRAVSKALGEVWRDTYLLLCVYGYGLCDMPSANVVWGSLLRDRGYAKRIIDQDGSYTVEQFCRDHPSGTYMLALSGHVIAVVDGRYYDSWDSGHELPIYYWEEDER